MEEEKRKCWRRKGFVGEEEKLLGKIIGEKEKIWGRKRKCWERGENME